MLNCYKKCKRVCYKKYKRRKNKTVGDVWRIGIGGGVRFEDDSGGWVANVNSKQRFVEIIEE